MPTTVWCGRKYGFSTDICVFQGIWDGLAGTTMLICGVCMLLINGGNKLPALQQCWDLGPTYVISFLILFGCLQPQPSSVHSPHLFILLA